MRLRDWFRRTMCRQGGRAGALPVGRLEPLEPRVLLSAEFAAMVSAMPPDAGCAEHAVIVDWENELGHGDAGRAAPVLPGMEVVDPDGGKLGGQVIWLRFEGAPEVVYDGPVTIGPFDVPAFDAAGRFPGRRETVVTEVLELLERLFAGSGVVFTTDRPHARRPYSTVYIGGDGRAFAEHGSFFGLAEAVDVGNRHPDDEAFVFSHDIASRVSQMRSYISVLTDVIAHEVGHLLGYAHTPSASASGRDAAGLLEHVAHFAGPDDGGSAEQTGPVHQWLTHNAYLFYDSQFAGSELADFIGDWRDYGSKHHRTNGDDNDVIEGAFDEDVSKPTTYIFDDGFHWDIAPQNPLGQDIPYYRHFAAGGDGDEIYDGWADYASAVTQAVRYWGDYVLGNYPADKALSYYYLGHVAHLLEDMTVPAHVHNDGHPFRDAYEYTVGEGSNYLLWGWGEGLRAQPTGAIDLPTDLISLFRETIDYTEEYDSDDVYGDDEPEIPNVGRHRPDLVSRAGGFTGDGQKLDLSSDNEITILADDLMSWAMERTAALFRLFYMYIDFTAPTVDLVTSFGPTEQEAVLKPSQFHVAASAEDDSGGYDADGFRFHVDRKVGGAWEPLPVDPNAGEFVFQADADGLYRIWAEVQDVAGNVGASGMGYFSVDSARGLQAVHRFWSPAYSRHFYTISDVEKTKLIEQYAHVWAYEGVVSYAFAGDAEPDVTPVYRFWSGALRTHFYTNSESEKVKLDEQHAEVWTYEGVAFYAYAEGVHPHGTGAVYRFWSGTLRCHFYTMSPAEKSKLLDLYPLIWTYERICWYAYSA